MRILFLNLPYDFSILARRSRCFARKLDTLYTVMDVFVEAYNRFGMAEHRYRAKSLLPSSIFFRRAFGHSLLPYWLAFMRAAC